MKIEDQQTYGVMIPHTPIGCLMVMTTASDAVEGIVSP